MTNRDERQWSRFRSRGPAADPRATHHRAGGYRRWTAFELLCELAKQNGITVALRVGELVCKVANKERREPTEIALSKNGQHLVSRRIHGGDIDAAAEPLYDALVAEC